MKKRNIFSRLLRAFQAFERPLSRQVLPLSSPDPVLPTQELCVVGSITSALLPERLYISPAGTPGGAADWSVNDIKIDGKSQFQFQQSGSIPGNMFSTDAKDGFTTFDPALPGSRVELFVTYIGSNEKGCPFFASLVGIEYDPGILDILKEAFSVGLSRAARGFFLR